MVRSEASTPLPATQGAYAAAVKLLDPLRQVPLGKLGAEDLDALYAKLEADGKANATICRVPAQHRPRGPRPGRTS